MPKVSRGLEAYSVKVVEVTWPIRENDLQAEHKRLLRVNPNCCGWREFYKFAVWTLVQYERVMLLDSDLQVVVNVDHLLQCSTARFQATPGFYSPLNGGMWVVTPSLCTLWDVISVVKLGRFTNCLHWGNLGLQKNHIGSEGPQGFLYYYYYVLAESGRKHIHRGQGRYLDKCMYNSNLKYCMQPHLPHSILGPKVYIVHKPDADLTPSHKLQLGHLRYPQFSAPAASMAAPTMHRALNILFPRAARSLSLGKLGSRQLVLLRPAYFSKPPDSIECTFGGQIALSTPRAVDAGGFAGTRQRTVPPRDPGPAPAAPPPPLGEPGHVHVDISRETNIDTFIARFRSKRDDPGHRFGLLIADPLQAVLDALAANDPSRIGATGSLAARMANGTATLRDYLRSPPGERPANPMVAAFSGNATGSVRRPDVIIARTRMLGFEFIIGLASMLAETVYLWKRLYGLAFPHIKACGPTAAAAQQQQPTQGRASASAEERIQFEGIHSLDYVLYESARANFKRMFYHEFGVRLPDKGRALNCHAATVACHHHLGGGRDARAPQVASQPGSPGTCCSAVCDAVEFAAPPQAAAT